LIYSFDFPLFMGFEDLVRRIYEFFHSLYFEK